MKILYLERDHGNSYSYYNEILSSLASQEGVEGIIKYSDWYPQDEHPLDIRYVLDRCEEEPDVIVVGFGWTDCSNAHPKPLVGTKEASVPVSIILNKEYAALDKKLSWIRDVDPIAAFTVHHDYKLYEKQTSVPFYQIPFAVNEKVFKNYGQNYSHDFGFSGVIRPKIWLSTTGPADLVGTRYCEVMACNTTLLACNRAKKVYGGLFEEDKHCIMFDTLQELQDKIHYYINHEDERESMIQRAYDHVLQNHTWNNRGEEMINTLTKKLEKQNGKA